MTTSIPSLFAGLDLDPATLAALHNAYAAPAQKSEEKGKGDKPKAPRTPREKGEGKKEKEPIKWLVAGTASDPKLPQQDPILFLTALRDGGKRESVNEVTGQVVMVHDPIAQRLDEKFAVALFNGWSNEPHGTQLDRATLHARFLTEPKGTVWEFPHRSPETHSARWSAAGFIAGMPNATQKVLGDLAGRERVCVEEVATMTALYESCDGADPITFERRLLKLAKDEPSLAAMIKQRPELIKPMYVVALQRLEHLREDLAGLYNGDLSAEAIERAHRCLLGRGMPTFEEELSLLNTTPKN